MAPTPGLFQEPGSWREAEAAHCLPDWENQHHRSAATEMASFPPCECSLRLHSRAQRKAAYLPFLKQRHEKFMGWETWPLGPMLVKWPRDAHGGWAGHDRAGGSPSCRLWACAMQWTGRAERQSQGMDWALPCRKALKPPSSASASPQHPTQMNLPHSRGQRGLRGGTQPDCSLPA